MNNIDYLDTMAFVKGGRYLAGSEQSVFEVDLLKSEKMGKLKIWGPNFTAVSEYLQNARYSVVFFVFSGPYTKSHPSKNNWWTSNKVASAQLVSMCLGAMASFSGPIP